MSVFVEYELRCNGVAGTSPFDCPTPPIFELTRSAARAAGKRQGWEVGQPGGLDFCPDCRAARRGLCPGLTEAQVDTFVLAPCGRRDAHPEHPAE